MGRQFCQLIHSAGKLQVLHDRASPQVPSHASGVTTPGTGNGRMPPRRDADVHLGEDTCVRRVRSSTSRDSELETDDPKPSLRLTPWKPLVCWPQLRLPTLPHGEGQASHVPLAERRGHKGEVSR